MLNDWSPEDESCSFRILIGPEGRGQGLGTEATRLIVGYGSSSSGCTGSASRVYAFNPRAQRAYEKAGFVVEGRIRGTAVGRRVGRRDHDVRAGAGVERATV